MKAPQKNVGGMLTPRGNPVKQGKEMTSDRSVWYKTT
jgi:hypothetical protein